jgi:enamine deaminase RidA (YjgF/YER057c/UK114 family)
MQKTAYSVTPGGWAQANGVADAATFLFISGQVPVGEGGVVPVDFAEQSHLVWGNLKAQLANAGMTLENVVKLTIFLTDASNGKAMAAVRSEYFGPTIQPAVTTVIAGLFDPRWQIEIEAIAAA